MSIERIRHVVEALTADEIEELVEDLLAEFLNDAQIINIVKRYLASSQEWVIDELLTQFIRASAKYRDFLDQIDGS
jgi:hypothetical protein